MLCGPTEERTPAAMPRINQRLKSEGICLCRIAMPHSVGGLNQPTTALRSLRRGSGIAPARGNLQACQHLMPT